MLKSILGSVFCLAATIPFTVVAAQGLPEKVQRVFDRSLLSIGFGEVSGSGFLVSNEGHVVTALHVLRAISQSKNSNISYFRTVYRARLNISNVEGVTDCTARLNLVAADANRDVAVLQIAPRKWLDRQKSVCLRHLEPTPIMWDIDLLTSGEKDEGGSELLGENIFVMGRPSGCRRVSGPCIAHDFAWFASDIHVTSDELGLHGVTKRVLPGLSGGPAVLKTGEVIGMTVASGRDMRVDQVKVAPIAQLHRPLWDFGLADLGEEKGVGDYAALMVELIRKRKEIDRVLEVLKDVKKEDLERTMNTLDELKNKLNQPELIDARIDKGQGGQEFITLEYRKQVSTALTPQRGEFLVECVPSDSVGYSYAAASTFLTDASTDDIQDLKNDERRLQFENSPIERDVSDGNRLIFVILNPVDYVKGICVDYFNKISKLSNQKVEFKKDDFVKFNIRGLAVFDTPGADSRPLPYASIELGVRQ